MPANYCELELRVSWEDQGEYSISARLVDPLNDLVNDIIESVNVRIDEGRLRQLWDQHEAYGAALAEMVFGPIGHPLRGAYERATAMAGDRNLRVRLSIQQSAPELHTLRWELLSVPGQNVALFARPRVWLSRFLSAEDIRLRDADETSELKVLLVVASPSDVQSKWQQAPFDANGEFARASEAISSGVARGGRKMVLRKLETRATLFNLIAALKHEHADVLYLVCHGIFTEDGEARLLLEADSGQGEMVRGEQVVERLTNIDERPRLVVLGSCESAAGGFGSALSAVGPRFAQAGVPGVVAMQGSITLESMKKFVPALFYELSRDGLIDRAVANARSTIIDRADWWMPVLFMRSRTGSLWPARAKTEQSFDNWEGVTTDLKEELCVPVLGPGLVESTFGSTRDMARQWAQFYEFPLALRNRDDLAQVAQYLSYRHSSAHVLGELREYLVRHIQRNFHSELPPEMQFGAPKVDLSAMAAHVVRLQRKRDPDNVHSILARFPAKLYINANRDNLLLDALRAEGRAPRVNLCTWRQANGLPYAVGPALPKNFVPSVQEPLIFHVFGHLDHPLSMVLTEDDYFAFLASVARNESLRKACVPDVVTSALASSGLLLLGFQADDWAFRVLFSSILKQPGNPAAESRTRVAIQLEPVEGQIIDPDRTLIYLRKYFERQARISVFWGSVEEFLRRLSLRLREEQLLWSASRVQAEST